MVVVEVGAGLRSYFADDRAVVDGYEADELASSGRGQLLIPWPNRIEDGNYEFEGVRQQLPLDEPERQNAIHGLVRWSALADRGTRVWPAALEHLLHPRPGYLFSLALRVEYTLSDEGLTVRTEATNLGNETAPYGGARAHPYLAVGAGRIDAAELRVPARTVLEANERGIPGRLQPSWRAPHLDFRVPRAIGAAKLDHAFTDLERGSDGLARVELTADGRQVTLWADESYPYLMVFTGDTLPDGGRRSAGRRADDLRAECFPQRRRTGPPGARADPHQLLGDRARRRACRLGVESCGVLCGRAHEADRDEIGGMDPRVGESDSSGPRDLVAQGNRPSVLEQSNCGSGAVGNGVGQVPDRVVIEHVSVFEFRSACDRTALGFFLAARAEAHEGADDRAELLCLILIEVARLQRPRSPRRRSSSRAAGRSSGRCRAS